jgi:hypothetical protein
VADQEGLIREPQKNLPFCNGSKQGCQGVFNTIGYLVSRSGGNVAQVFVNTVYIKFVFVRVKCLKIKNTISPTYLIEVVDIFFFLYYVAAEIFSK